MTFRRSSRQRRPFQSADSGECWRSSALAAGKLHNHNDLSRSCIGIMSQWSVKMQSFLRKMAVKPKTKRLFKASQTCSFKTPICHLHHPLRSYWRQTAAFCTETSLKHSHYDCQGEQYKHCPPYSFFLFMFFRLFGKNSFSLLACFHVSSSVFSGSSRFVALANKDVNQAGRTKLDRERLKSCMREMVWFMFLNWRRKEAAWVKEVRMKLKHQFGCFSVPYPRVSSE